MSGGVLRWVYEGVKLRRGDGKREDEREDEEEREKGTSSDV